MTEQPKENTSDEIDLGQLFRMIGNWFNKLGLGFLKLFLYLKKRALILGGLIVLGLGIGYGLNQITEKKKKIEVIVKPNLDSENYLYDVVGEIQGNIKAKDTAFFKGLGVPTNNIGQYKIEVEPIEVEKKRKGDLELFEKFKDNPNFSSIIRNELQKNSTSNHRITFTFKNVEEGQVFAQKIMKYINSAEFFQQLVEISNENARTRIKQNELLIEQIDILISNYTKSIGTDKSQLMDNKISLDNQEPMDITGLFQLKNQLIQNTAQRKIELQEQQNPINILNFGKSQEVIKPFFGKKLVLIPLTFIGVFFLFELVFFINRKALTLNK
ncbi:MAG: hypothetical protein AAF620_18595 [Bacteroidota bacterium]